MLAVTLILAAVVLLGIGRGEVAKIHARYGSLIVSVAGADARDAATTMEVASIQDLVRLAERDQRMVLHQRLGTECHRYSVHDGDIIYQYYVTGGQGGTRPQATSHTHPA